ncbi:MAG TPA: hypothetical protein VFK07_02700 [Candidatus Paceibacterota bacterium]|nr:hypothetical protein [Candidatus Paceibacterota bacterium]
MLRLADNSFYRMMLVYMRKVHPLNTITVECLIKTGRLGAFDGIGYDEVGASFIKGALIANINDDILEFKQIYDPESVFSRGADWSVKHTLTFYQSGGWSGVWQIEDEKENESGQCFASVVISSSDRPFSMELMEYYKSWDNRGIRLTGVTIH